MIRPILTRLVLVFGLSLYAQIKYKAKPEASQRADQVIDSGLDKLAEALLVKKKRPELKVG